MQPERVGALILGPVLACVAMVVQADTLGTAISQQGGSKMLVNAGDAIQATCRSLVAAGGPALTGRSQDLYFRCNEMVTTYGLGLPANPTANTYGYASNSDRSNAVRQFSGEEASSQRRLETQTNSLQFGGIGARMDAIRRGARTTGSAFALNGDNGDLLGDGLPAIAQVGGGAGDESEADTGWAWFGNVNSGYADHDRTPNEDAYDSDYYGGTLGVDYAFLNGLVVGMALGYENYSADVKSSGAPTPASPTSPTTGGGVEGDSYAASAYALFDADVYSISTIISYGQADYDLDRRAYFLPGASPQGRPAAADFEINRSYRANTDSDQFGAEVTLTGSVIADGPYLLDAYVKLDYLSMYIDGYTEKERDNSANPTPTPGLALKYQGQDVDTIETGLGFTMRRSFNTGFGVVVPYIGGEWRYVWDGGSGVVKYAYAYGLPALPGGNVNFATPTDNSDKGYGLAPVGVSTQFARNLSFYVQYEGLVGLNNTTGGMGTIGLRGRF